MSAARQTSIVVEILLNILGDFDRVNPVFLVALSSGSISRPLMRNRVLEARW